MKTNFLIFALFLIGVRGWAQLTRVNESCKQMPCEERLYCLTLKNGDQKCATCDQSTLNDLTGKVDDACKSFDVAWTPENSSEFQEVLAVDGRVMVDVYDVMLEKAKRCKEAREYREYKCWDNGDREHLDAIKRVAESIDRIATHKYRQISDRRVYYCSKSTYESRLSTFNSKCNLNFPDINQQLNILLNNMGNKTPVSCSDIDRYGDDCERCFAAAKDLYYDGFRSTSSYFPYPYQETMDKAESTYKSARSLKEMAYKDNLCK